MIRCCLYTHCDQLFVTVYVGLLWSIILYIGLILFIYLFAWCGTPCSRMFQLSGGGQLYGGNLPKSRSQRKSTTSRRWLTGLLTYGQRGSHDKLDLNSRRPHGWQTPGSLRCSSPQTDWATYAQDGCITPHWSVLSTCTMAVSLSVKWIGVLGFNYGS